MCDFCGTIKICTNPVLKLHNLRVLLTTNTKNTQLTDGEGNIIQSKMFLPLIMAHTSLLYNYQRGATMRVGKKKKKFVLTGPQSMTQRSGRVLLLYQTKICITMPVACEKWNSVACSTIHLNSSPMLNLHFNLQSILHHCARIRVFF